MLYNLEDSVHVNVVCYVCKTIILVRDLQTNLKNMEDLKDLYKQAFTNYLLSETSKDDSQM